jgi:hypothetical protein
MRRPSYVLLVASVLSCGCVNEHAPDPSKVIAATKKVEQSQKAARDVHREERQKIEEAQKTTDEISVVSMDLLQKVDSLAQIIPEQFQPPLAAIREDVTGLQAKETVLTTGLVQAWQKNDAVEKHLAETDANLAGLKTEQQNYYNEAVAQADEWTADKEKLWWYRLHWWGSWIALGAGVLACVIFAIIKWGAKWTAKLGVAGAKIGL